MPGDLALLAHEARAIRAIGRVLVVRAAAQPCVRRARESSAGHGLYVIELEPRARFTAMVLVADERALAAVSLPDDATDLGGNVTAVRDAAARARAGGP